VPIQTVFHRILGSLILILVGLTTQAQICNGSFGDPVVNITFGTPANPDGQQYVPASSYIYTNSFCPDDGYYTITSSTANCFGSTWYTVSSDHTGGGNFMLVNASFQPGDFFVTKVGNLCPNTTYEFSAWIMNLLNRFNTILPNITFHIEQPDGTVLAKFESGDIPVTTSPQWNQYGFLFTTPTDNAEIVLRLTNNAPGGIGNDLALDDITFRPCGAKISAEIEGANTDTVNICEGNLTTYTFLGTASALYQSPVYNWQVSTDSGATWNNIPGATDLTYVRSPETAPGDYWYRLSVVDATVAGFTSCKIGSNVLVINVHPKPLVDAGTDRVYIKGYPVTLSASASGENISFNWVPTSYMDNPSTLNPTVAPPVNIKYILYAQSAFGCSNQDSMEVKVAGGIFVPNAFTPNNDGKNDYWRIPYLDIGFDAEVNVFNRAGQLVYHVSGAVVSWDGKYNGEPQPAGVYVYVITFKQNTFPKMKGTVTLIR
jgi:gliding motility-associated-like protein